MTEIFYRGLAEPNKIKRIEVPTEQAEKAIEMIRGSQTLDLIEN